MLLSKYKMCIVWMTFNVLLYFLFSRKRKNVPLCWVLHSQIIAVKNHMILKIHVVRKLLWLDNLSRYKKKYINFIVYKFFSNIFICCLIIPSWKKVILNGMQLKKLCGQDILLCVNGTFLFQVNNCFPLYRSVINYTWFYSFLQTNFYYFY